MKQSTTPADKDRMSFVDRIGQAIVAPRRAFAAADDEIGGSPDAALLMLFKLVGIQVAALITAVWTIFAVGPGYGFPPLLHIVAEVISVDLIALIAGGFLVTALAGGKRSISRDFDLAAVAWVPFFAITMVHTLIITILGRQLPPWLGSVASGLAFAWMAAWIGLAIQHARARQSKTATGAES